MDVAVQKYGGSSLATAEQLRNVAEQVHRCHRSGRPTVVVVSARGDTTDRLLRTAGEISLRHSAREIDQILATGENVSAAVLALALRDRGISAVSLSGRQAGIRATGRHGRGIISTIDPSRIRKHLQDREVVVVAGFQGVNDDDDVVTLGRGGSDTTAIALAVGLDAKNCEIYTDVDGVFTADPRIVRTARLLRVIDSGIMAEMAFSGARVVHSRAVELAAANGVDVFVRSSSTHAPGTTIVGRSGTDVVETRGFVVAVTHDLDVATVLIRLHLPGRDIAVHLLSALADESVPVDLVTWSTIGPDEFRMGFTLRRGELPTVERVLADTLAELEPDIQIDREVGKLSLVGTGLLNRPEHTSRMLGALAAVGISARWISTTQSRTSVVIPLDRVIEAVEIVHREFDLDRDSFAVESMATV